MMDRLIVSLCLIAVAAAACWCLMLKARSSRYNRLITLAKAGDAEGFKSCMSSNLSRMLISPFAKCRLQLELAGSTGNREEIRSAVNELMKLKISDSQRYQVATTAFVMLAELDDKKGCKRLVEEIESISPENSEGYRIYYDTVMCEKGRYRSVLESRLSALERTPARKTRGHLEYLLSCAYRADGDDRRARMMRERAAHDLDVEEERLEGAIDVAACI